MNREASEHEDKIYCQIVNKEVIYKTLINKVWRPNNTYAILLDPSSCSCARECGVEVIKEKSISWDWKKCPYSDGVRKID